MKSNLFIPKTIKVGYQNRSDTYTKKLAYVIYYDAKNVLRKEKSWEGWRDKSIEANDFENVPTSGFVLNKKVGDYQSDWNHRMAHIRVYDPRNFEFEISVENLLYILENNNSIKGKGLEGEFVYGYEGKDLVLVPVSSPDYEDLKLLNSLRFNKNLIKSKDLKLGATYLTTANQKLVYLGNYDYYERDSLNYWGESDNPSYGYTFKEPVKRFYFGEDFVDGDFGITNFKSISGKFIAVVDENCSENYSEYYSKMICNYNFSPIDESKTELIPFTKDEISEIIEESYSTQLYSKTKQKYFYIRKEYDRSGKPNKYFINYDYSYYHNSGNGNVYSTYGREMVTPVSKEEILEQAVNEYEFCYANIYLKNGELFEKRRKR